MSRIVNGVLIKGIGGFYYVRCGDGQVIECKARGIFRKEGITPAVGDRVVVLENAEGGFVIDEILKRKNELIRPFVSNIDNLVIVLSAHKPKPDFMLCDKLIVSAMINGIRPIICVNKMDKASKSLLAQIKDEYRMFDIVFVSAHTKEGAEDLLALLKGGCSAFAGQSAVGKSSILNMLFEDLSLETGGLSKKTDRGRHTTRHVELIYKENINGYVVDTPGFSVFDAFDIKKEELRLYYPEFRVYDDKCRFTTCLHIGEPDCVIKDAVAEGKISRGRYERYKLLFEKLKEKEEKQYD